MGDILSNYFESLSFGIFLNKLMPMAFVASLIIAFIYYAVKQKLGPAIGLFAGMLILFVYVFFLKLVLVRPVIPSNVRWYIYRLLLLVIPFIVIRITLPLVRKDTLWYWSFMLLLSVTLLQAWLSFGVIGVNSSWISWLFSTHATGSTLSYTLVACCFGALYLFWLFRSRETDVDRPNTLWMFLAVIINVALLLPLISGYYSLAWIAVSALAGSGLVFGRVVMLRRGY